MGKQLILVFLMLCVVMPISATSNSADVRNHLIVAFDWAPTPNAFNNKWMFTDETKAAVKSLSQYMVADGQGQLCPVLGEGDNFSCVAFRANIDKNSLEHFIRPISNEQDSLVHIENVSSSFQRQLDAEWNSWLTSKPYGENFPEGFSLLTVAKPYCFNYFSKCDKKAMTSRTFMVVVSDRRFNGDLYLEIVNLRQSGQKIYKLPGIKDDEVYSVCYDVNQSYFIRLIKTEEIKMSKSANPSGYVELFEFVPLQKNFSLNSVFELPKTIKAKRVRGGKYQCDLSLINRQNDNYKPLKLSIRINDESCGTFGADELSSRIEIPIEVDNKNKADEIELEGEVLLTDGVYNSTLITANPSAIVESGRDGAIVRIPIEYEPTAEIFGVIPLPDFLWWGIFPDDQEDTAMLWQFIFSIIILCIVVVSIVSFIKKKQYYTPTIDEIEINIPSNLKK